LYFYSIHLTFSRNFITGELRFVDDDDSPELPGVITIGGEFIDTEDSIKEKQAEVDGLAVQAEGNKNELTRLQAEKDKTRKVYVNTCWAKGKEYKQTFGGSGAFSGTEKFADTLMTTQPKEHGFDDIKARFMAASDPNARCYDQPFAQLDLSKLDGAEGYSLLAERIVSTSDSDFNRFMQSLGAAKWVENGYKLYAPNADGKCPYCQQSIEDSSIDINAEIAKCFDGKYAEDCAKLADYQQKYRQYMESTFITPIRRNIEFLKSIPQGFGNVAEYEKNLAQIEKIIAENNQSIAVKVANPSEAVSLETIRPYLEAIDVLIIETNNLFTKNNDIYDNQGKARTACLSEVVELSAFELQTVIKQYKADMVDVESKITAQQTKVGNSNNSLSLVKGELSKLTEKLGGIEATVPKVNDLLIKTGFRGFSLVPHETVPNRYVVVREDGSPATRLSEGERNFIAFLYFYYLVQGSWKQEDLMKGKIVVIDDPVSSMDSSVLSTVSSLVRELINDCYCDGEKHNIKQIFILTHNAYFHNAVSHEMLRPEEAFFKKVAFFEVKKSDDNISIISEPCMQGSHSNDPDITHENYSPVQNSYSALWQEYKNAKLPTTLLHTINRIVEYHFILLCSHPREELQNRLFGEFEKDTSKLRLAKEILQNVHDNVAFEDSIGEMIHYPAPSSTADYRRMFRELFKVMGQEPHYSKMSGEG